MSPCFGLPLVFSNPERRARRWQFLSSHPSLQSLFFFFLSNPIFVVLVLPHYLFYATLPRSVPEYNHASNRSRLLLWNTRWLCHPMFELSSRGMPLWWVEPHLSFVLVLEKVAQTAVESLTFKCGPFWKEVDMKVNLSQVNDTVLETIIGTIWWKVANEN